MTAHERETIQDRCARCDGAPDAQALLAEARAQVEEARRERDEAQEQLLADARDRLLEHGSDEDAEQLRRERDAMRAAVVEWMDECSQRSLAAEQGVKVAEALATEKDALLSRVVVLEAALRGLRYPGEPERFCDHAAAPCDRCDAARRALEAKP